STKYPSTRGVARVENRSVEVRVRMTSSVPTHTVGGHSRQTPLDISPKSRHTFGMRWASVAAFLARVRARNKRERQSSPQDSSSRSPGTPESPNRRPSPPAQLFALSATIQSVPDSTVRNLMAEEPER